MWDSRVMKHGLRLGFNGQFDDFDDFDDKGRPVLITAAAPSYEVEHRTRVRKYLTLMAFRVPALILAAIAYGAWHNGLISLLIVAASVPLPWMAVLIANDRPPRRADDNQADANHLHHRYRRAEKQYGDQHNGGRTDCRPQRIGDVRLHAVRDRQGHQRESDAITH